MSIKVSVIVPVYNVEAYLAEALDSLLQQTLQEMEIICINDGATDNSPAILEAYAKKDSRIVLIHKENGGYGIGMNMGMARAKGEYIGILEPDDYIEPTMFADLYEKAKAYDLDFIKSDFYRFKKNAAGVEKSTYFALTPETDWYNKVFDPSMTPEAIRLTMNTWTGIYRRGFLEAHHIRHNETPGASFQDNGFFFQTFAYAKRAMIVDTPYYHNRRDNPNSSVKDTRKVYCMNAEYDHIRRLLSKDKEVWERFAHEFWRKYYNNCENTFYRIDKTQRDAYIQRVHREFVWAKKRGELKEEIFGVTDSAKLRLLLKSPREYSLRLRKIQRVRKIQENPLGKILYASYYRLKTFVKK